MTLDTWLVFLLASIGLSLAPGPNSLLALTHGALHGRHKTLFTISGGSLGFVALIALSMFGIGALLKASIVWFTVLKWVGGLYLMWLGIQVWRAPPVMLASPAEAVPASRGAMFRQGALAAATNPKGLLFFSAFLPHFIDPEHSLVLQFVLMAATFVAIEFVTEYVLASAAHVIRPWLVRAGRRFNHVCGGLFVLIGAGLLWRE